MTLTFHAAPENTGVVFVRTDVPGHKRIPALVQNRVTGPRRTTLVSDGCPVEMVEHVLSALAAMKVDNCEVHVDQAEMPGMDGSSLPFVRALQFAGKQELDATRKTLFVHQQVRLGDEDSWIELSPAVQNEFELEFHLHYPGCDAVGRQHFKSVLTADRYCTDIAPARTFVLDSEADQLRMMGLGTRVTTDDILVFNHAGPIDNSLRYDNECARHKVLDMIGDFALVGADIVGRFTACKSGHLLNSQVAFELLRQNSIALEELDADSAIGSVNAPVSNQQRLSA